MPIDEISDYPEKMTEFELHWDSVNLELGGAPETDFKLAGDFDRAAFSTLKASVVAALTNQEGLENNLDFARSDRDQLRTELRQTLILFRNTVKALLPDSRYLRALPDVPGERADQQKFLDAWDDAAHIWTQINTDQPPEVAPAMTLRGGYALAQFQTDVATMRTRYDAVKAAERATSDGRGTRDELLESAYDRMVQYRQRLPLTLAADHALVLSMPKITPSSGGNGGGPVLPTFPFNWLQSEPGTVLIWFTMIAGLTDVFTLFAREGAEELSYQVDGVPPDQTVQATWVDVTITGEVDEVTLRNSQGIDVARGVFDSNLPNPGP